MVRCTKKSASPQFLLQLDEQPMLLDLITFERIEHGYPAIDGAVEDRLWFPLIKTARLDGSDDLTHIASHHRLQLVAVCELVVLALAS